MFEFNFWFFHSSILQFFSCVENIGRREQNGRDLNRDHYHNHNDDMREDARELSSVERGACTVHYLTRICKFTIIFNFILAESNSSYEGSSRRRRRQKNNSAAHNSEYDVAKFQFSKRGTLYLKADCVDNIITIRPGVQNL